MAATTTLTGTAGPGLAVTAQVSVGLLKVEFDCVANLVNITDENNYVRTISIAAATTITATKSGSAYTFVVS